MKRLIVSSSIREASFPRRAAAASRLRLRSGVARMALGFVLQWLWIARLSVSFA